MDNIDVVAEFKRSLCGFYGYDEKLKYVGSKKSSAQPTEPGPFLGPRDFLNFAVEDSTGLDKEKNLVNCLGNCKRAIDAQVDRLIGRLGFFPACKEARLEHSKEARLRLSERARGPQNPPERKYAEKPP